MLSVSARSSKQQMTSVRAPNSPLATYDMEIALRAGQLKYHSRKTADEMSPTADESDEMRPTNHHQRVLKGFIPSTPEARLAVGGACTFQEATG